MPNNEVNRANIIAMPRALFILDPSKVKVFKGNVR
jgi:hypothetical protein